MNFKNFINREQNLLIHFMAVIIVSITGLILKISLTKWLIVLLLFTFVISSELINSSIELVVDLYSLKKSKKAKVAKDVAASAVLISAITSIIVGMYIFIPEILK
ncbi:MAG: diacylglycerol kinase family protein [Bacilli bacterium]